MDGRINVRDLSEAFPLSRFTCQSPDVLRYIPVSACTLRHPDAAEVREWLVARRSIPADLIDYVAERYTLLYWPERTCLILPHVANRVIVGASMRFTKAKAKRERWRTHPTENAAWFVLYDQDVVLCGGRNLWVMEGTLDAVSFHAACKDQFPDDVATSTMHLGATDSQKAILRGVSGLYENVFICFDGDAPAHTKLYAEEIQARSVIIPRAADDFGSLPLHGIRLTVQYATDSISPIVRVPAKRVLAWR